MHQSLEHMRSDKKRRNTCLEILEKFEKIEAMQDQVDKYVKTGELPEQLAPAGEEFVLPDSVPELIQRRLTLRTYISKNKSKPENTAKWKQELEAIQKKLNAD